MTQSLHLEPPYALRTVFLVLEIVAYLRGRRAGTWKHNVRIPDMLSQYTKRSAYTRESNTAVTALGGSWELFEVVVDELATWCLDHSADVRGGVIRGALADGDTLGHCWSLIDDICQ